MEKQFAILSTPHSTHRFYLHFCEENRAAWDYLKSKSIWKGPDHEINGESGFEVFDQFVEEVKRTMANYGMNQNQSIIED